MLTPRHQALLMTLAGMTVGVAVFGTVLAINGNGDDDKRATDVVVTQTPSSPTPRGDGLQSDSLQFAAQTFGTDRSPVSAEVPTTWRANQDGERPRFQDPSGVWQIRFDTRGSSKAPDRQVSDRERSIKETQLNVLSRDNGTLVYTYVDGARARGWACPAGSPPTTAAARPSRSPLVVAHRTRPLCAPYWSALRHRSSCRTRTTARTSS